MLGRSVQGMCPTRAAPAASRRGRSNATLRPGIRFFPRGGVFMSGSAAPRPVPPAAKAELTPTGKLRAGINFQNVLLTTRGPNGEQGGVAVEFARELASRLGVPLEIISYESAGALADSVSAGVWDISVLGIEPQ